MSHNNDYDSCAKYVEFVNRANTISLVESDNNFSYNKCDYDDDISLNPLIQMMNIDPTYECTLQDFCDLNISCIIEVADLDHATTYISQRYSVRSFKDDCDIISSSDAHNSLDHDECMAIEHFSILMSSISAIIQEATTEDIQSIGLHVENAIVMFEHFRQYGYTFSKDVSEGCKVNQHIEWIIILGCICEDISPTLLEYVLRITSCLMLDETYMERKFKNYNILQMCVIKPKYIKSFINVFGKEYMINKIMTHIHVLLPYVTYEVINTLLDEDDDWNTIKLSQIVLKLNDFRTDHNNNVLHYILSRKVNESALKEIMLLWPQLLELTNDEFITPIHVYLFHNSELYTEVDETIIEQNKFYLNALFKRTTRTYPPMYQHNFMDDDSFFKWFLENSSKEFVLNNLEEFLNGIIVRNLNIHKNYTHFLNMFENVDNEILMKKIVLYDRGNNESYPVYYFLAYIGIINTHLNKNVLMRELLIDKPWLLPIRHLYNNLVDDTDIIGSSVKLLIKHGLTTYIDYYFVSYVYIGSNLHHIYELVKLCDTNDTVKTYLMENADFTFSVNLLNCKYPNDLSGAYFNNMMKSDTNISECFRKCVTFIGGLYENTSTSYIDVIDNMIKFVYACDTYQKIIIKKCVRSVIVEEIGWIYKIGKILPDVVIKILDDMCDAFDVEDIFGNDPSKFYEIMDNYINPTRQMNKSLSEVYNKLNELHLLDSFATSYPVTIKQMYIKVSEEIAESEISYEEESYVDKIKMLSSIVKLPNFPTELIEEDDFFIKRLICAFDETHYDSYMEHFINPFVISLDPFSVNYKKKIIMAFVEHSDRSNDITLKQLNLLITAHFITEKTIDADILIKLMKKKTINKYNKIIEQFISDIDFNSIDGAGMATILCSSQKIVSHIICMYDTKCTECMMKSDGVEFMLSLQLDNNEFLIDVINNIADTYKCTTIKLLLRKKIIGVSLLQQLSKDLSKYVTFEEINTVHDLANLLSQQECVEFLGKYIANCDIMTNPYETICKDEKLVEILKDKKLVEIFMSEYRSDCSNDVCNSCINLLNITCNNEFVTHNMILNSVRDDNLFCCILKSDNVLYATKQTIYEKYPHLVILMGKYNDIHMEEKHSVLLAALLSPCIKDILSDLMCYVHVNTNVETFEFCLKNICYDCDYVQKKRCQIECLIRCNSYENSDDIYYNFICNKFYQDIDFVKLTDYNGNYFIMNIQFNDSNQYAFEMFAKSFTFDDLCKVCSNGMSLICAFLDSDVMINHVLDNSEICKFFETPTCVGDMLFERIVELAQTDAIMKTAYLRDYEDSHGRNILMMLIKYNKLDTLSELKRMSVLQDVDGNCSIHYAIRSSPDMLHIMINTYREFGLHKNIVNNDCETLVMYALRYCNNANIEQVLEILFNNFGPEQNYIFLTKGSVISYALLYNRDVIHIVLKWANLNNKSFYVTQNVSNVYSVDDDTHVNANLNVQAISILFAPEHLLKTIQTKDVFSKCIQFNMKIGTMTLNLFELAMMYDSNAFTTLLCLDYVTDDIIYDIEPNKLAKYTQNQISSLIAFHESSRFAKWAEKYPCYSNPYNSNQKYFVDKKYTWLYAKQEVAICASDKCGICMSGKKKIMFGCHKHLTCVTCAYNNVSDTCPFCRHDTEHDDMIKIFD
jgi:hypothetical protein